MRSSGVVVPAVNTPSGTVSRRARGQVEATVARHEVALVNIESARQLGIARIQATSDVTEAAVRETLSLALTRRQIEMLAPECAGYVELFHTKAALAMADQIDRPGKV